MLWCRVWYASVTAAHAAFVSGLSVCQSPRLYQLNTSVLPTDVICLIDSRFSSPHSVSASSPPLSLSLPFPPHCLCIHIIPYIVYGCTVENLSLSFPLHCLCIHIIPYIMYGCTVENLSLSFPLHCLCIHIIPYIVYGCTVEK